ncbi:MAG: copper chaperone PCu(A)C [Mesorhizobium sp.]
MPLLRAMILAAAASAVLAPPLVAAEHQHVATKGNIRILHAWTRAASAGSDTLVFMDIENRGAADRLLAAETEKAGRAEIVGITMQDGNSGATPLGPVDIATGKTTLDPGGMAIALRGLTGDLVKGEDFGLTLQFEKTGAVELGVEIQASDAMQHSHAGHAH